MLQRKPHDKPNCQCAPCKEWLEAWKKSVIEDRELELAILEYRKQELETELKTLKSAGTSLVIP